MEVRLATVQSTIDRTLTSLETGLEVAVPRVVNALVLLLVAFVAISIGTWVLKRLLNRLFPPEESLIADLVVVVISVFLWFGVGLALLNVLGLDEIAASIGTAVGFIALGISYALSEMIEDTVAGVYLLRDPDFNVGDSIEADGVTGEITAIELRKTRFRTADGDLTVMSNRNVERRWTQRAGRAGPSTGS